MPTLKRLAIAFVSPVLFIALLLGALMLFQDRLLYFPSRVALEQYVPDGLYIWPRSSAISEQENAQALEAVSLDTQNGLLGLIGYPENEQPVTGTAIVFHGNAGHAGHRSYYAQQLTKLGVRTILAEYPGYGPRPGSPSEDVLISDGVDIVNRVYKQYAGPLWLVGESLGAGVAAGVLKEVPSLVDGIVLITPWNRLMDVAAFHYPFLPVRWLLRSEYDSIAALNEFAGPKLIIVAQNDRIVPAELGLDLYEQISQPKRLVSLKGTGHNDWMMHREPEFWRINMNWLTDAIK